MELSDLKKQLMLENENINGHEYVELYIAESICEQAYDQGYLNACNDCIKGLIEKSKRIKKDEQTTYTKVIEELRKIVEIID